MNMYFKEHFTIQSYEKTTPNYSRRKKIKTNNSTPVIFLKQSSFNYIWERKPSGV